MKALLCLVAALSLCCAAVESEAELSVEQYKTPPGVPNGGGVNGKDLPEPKPAQKAEGCEAAEWSVLLSAACAVVCRGKMRKKQSRS